MRDDRKDLKIVCVSRLPVDKSSLLPSTFYITRSHSRLKYCFLFVGDRIYGYLPVSFNLNLNLMEGGRKIHASLDFLYPLKLDIHAVIRGNHLFNISRRPLWEALIHGEKLLVWARFPSDELITELSPRDRRLNRSEILQILPVLGWETAIPKRRARSQ